MISINFENKIFTSNEGETIKDILSKNNIDCSKFAAVYLNNHICSLLTRVINDVKITPIYINSHFGEKICFNTYAFLVNKALKKFYPDKNCILGHSLSNSLYFYFYDFILSETQLKEVEKEVSIYIESNCLIEKKYYSYEQLVDFLKENNYDSTLKLVESNNCPYIKMYNCEGYTEFQLETLLDEPKKLPSFELKKNRDGFVIKLKDREFKDNILLYNVFKEHNIWGKILNVGIVGELNNLISEKKIDDFIKVNESLQENSLYKIASNIYDNKDDVKIVFLAGPSSSGKTTTLKRLSIQLKVLGFNTILISLDDYYKKKSETPRDKNGEFDFESIDALNLDLFKDNIKRVLNGEIVKAPIYNFTKGEATNYKTLELQKDTIILVEGLHGLNPDLSNSINQKYKIYLSALTQLSIDNRNRISTTENRLLRRVVRDYHFRNTSAEATYKMWEKVRAGENKYIFPFQETADVAFNSALEYEFALLKTFAEPILKSVKPTSEYYEYSYHLQKILSLFLPIDPILVPHSSILREFIGGSSFKY